MTGIASAWNTILTAPELDAHYALTASLDPHFAKGERTFYESRTPTQLRVLAAQAWDCNDPTGYQLARSYLALAVAKPTPAFQDISHISEYGLTQKLSSAIRCF